MCNCESILQTRSCFSISLNAPFLRMLVVSISTEKLQSDMSMTKELAKRDVMHMSKAIILLNASSTQKLFLSVHLSLHHSNQV